MNAASLSIKDLVCGYGRSTVLHGVSINVDAGEVVTLVGANGAGKSTLLAAISGLLPVTSGGIEFDGQPIANLATNAIVRRKLIQVPERRQLFSSMTVEENLMLGAFTVPDARTIAARIQRAYELFPRLHERRSQVASSMSGGEQQMLAIARAMMAGPRLLLLDEPSLGLAPQVVVQVLDLVRQLRQEGCTILLVEQNARAALGVADRAYVMATGRIEREGTAAALISDPAVQTAYLGNESGAEGSMEDRIRKLKTEIAGPLADSSDKDIRLRP
jgi:branched-chain amino acid transport system ATP-binding protein